MKPDDAIDRLLRRTAGAASNAGAAGACLDADVLAAYSEGALTPAERASVEGHVSGCDRCFAILAEVARTAPPAQVPARQKAATWLSFRWLVPLASAAALVIAFALQRQSSPEVAPRPTPPPPAAAPTAAPEPTAAPARANETAAAARVESKQESARSAVQRREDLAKKKQANAPTPGAAAEKQVADRQAAAVDQLQMKPAAAPAPPPAAGAAAAPPPAVAETVAVDRIGERARAELRALQQAAPRVLMTPDANVRWRVNGRVIERSTDAGRTWSGAVAQTDRDVLGGACPSATVCWIVGRNGLVVVTDDGSTWRTISPPEASLDLVSVTATSATSATVTAANGRSYRTTDGGRTWTVQELPAGAF